MASVFQKFGGIRPMAAKLGGVPTSTVKSWHAQRRIPAWRHASILAAAARHDVELTVEELSEVRPEVAEPAGAEAEAADPTSAGPTSSGDQQGRM